MLDSACGSPDHSKLSVEQAYTTLELKIFDFRPITTETGQIRAEGRVASLGRSAAFAEAMLKEAEDRIYETATSTLLVMDRAKKQHALNPYNILLLTLIVHPLILSNENQLREALIFPRNCGSA